MRVFRAPYEHKESAARPSWFESLCAGGLIRSKGGVGTANRLLRHLVGKLRRFYLVHARKEHVKERLGSRGGDCRQCGACCAFIFSCPALDTQGLCRVYHTHRWAACKVFPIDERDVADVALAGGRCGYRFESR
jgi:hypothetical protein